MVEKLNIIKNNGCKQRETFAARFFFFFQINHIFIANLSSLYRMAGDTLVVTGGTYFQMNYYLSLWISRDERIPTLAGQHNPSLQFPAMLIVAEQIHRANWMYYLRINASR